MKAKLIKHGHSYALVLDEKLVAFAHPEDFNQNDTIGKLCLDNCQAIELNFDVVDHAIAYAGDKGHYLDPQGFSEKQIDLMQGYIDGFTQAIELLGDKKFSEVDVKNLIDNIHSIYEDGFSVATYHKKKRAYKLIQSLQQTEWDVEVEMEKYGRCELCLKAGMWHCAHADTCGSAVEAERPKLDADGCIILKLAK